MPIGIRGYCFISDFNHFPDDECYRTIHFCDDRTGKVYTDLMEIRILELRKLPEKVHFKGEWKKQEKYFSSMHRVNSRKK